MKRKRVKTWWLINIALTIAGRKVLGEMKKASKNGKKAQENILRHILTLSKDTVYGKEHHFSEILAAKTPEELFSLYRKNIPISDYEDFRPYVERHKNGETDILFPGKPKMYATTSGTTKEPKWIPVTEEYYSEVYQKMNRGWFYLMLQNKPKIYHGPGVSIVGKAIEGYAPDGTVYGSVSGVMQRDIPNFLKVLHTAPADVFHIENYRARYYAIMRMGIERDTHCIITANPSTLVEMQNNANDYFDDYCNDIEHGTVSKKFPIPDKIRAALEAYTKPNPQRAAELRKLKERHGTVLPKHYWPNMQVITCWLGGNARIYYEKVKEIFPPDCVFHEISYVASEVKAGLVLKSTNPNTVVFGHKNYFEFIHESEIENPNPRIYQLYEVEAGQRYCMLVTTSAGLYRYNMNDLMEITGWYNQFPIFKFHQKVNGIISLTGEKLHERQFIEAVQEAEQKTDRKTAFYAGFADIQKSNYKFYYEFEDQNISRAEAEEFTALVEQFMKEYNPEYRDKRASNRVKQPETALMETDSFERYKTACIDRGYRDGQFKLNRLMQDEKRQAMFEELVK